MIVGHGPSVVSARLGSWLDSQTVVRLKDCPYWKRGQKKNTEVWGTRIDFLCATKLDWRRQYHAKYDDKPPFWLFDKEKAWRHIAKKPRMPDRKLPLDQFYPDGVFVADTDYWMNYFLGFNPVRKPKPSVGLCALFCAKQQGYSKVGLIGFDSFFTDSQMTGKWDAKQEKCVWVHDNIAEQKALAGLEMEVINLGDPTRERPHDGG